MTKPTIPQSQKRQAESLDALFGPHPQAKGALILKSSTDAGVMRNGGRNGARLAPKSLLATLRRMTLAANFPFKAIAEVEVSNEELEGTDFAEAQLAEANRIAEELKTEPGFVLHVGGGHDHIYPLLRALEGSEEIIVINVDAHADTRTDAEAHSGTPFRQFAATYRGRFKLYQVGLHPWANSSSTLTPLEGMSILWSQDARDPEKIKDFFKEISRGITQTSKVIFSLDADALAGEIVPGVSAVNGQGFSVQDLRLLWKEYRKLLSHSPILGIYELNPVYDTVSSLSMRTIGSFLFECLQGE